MRSNPLPDGVRDPILFLYDDAIDSARNLRKKFHTPRKLPGNPVVRPDKPWEGSRVQPWGSVLPWDGKWRLLYSSWSDKGEGGIHVLESPDGKRWYRPDLGLHSWQQQCETNILFPGRQGQMWFLPSLIRHPDPPDPSWRFLFYAWGWGESSGLFVHKSADGLHFERAAEGPVLTHGWFDTRRTNDVAMAQWDARQSKFILYATVLLPQPPGQSTLWDNAPHMKRCLGRLESDDGVHWTGPELMLAPDRNEPQWQQYYGITVSQYEGLWIGFPLYYHVREQFMQPHVAFSRDGRTWDRPTRQPFLPCGDSPERWDYGNVILAWDFLRIGDELIFLYGGSAGKEHTNRMGMSMGVAVLRRDGFVSVAPGGADPEDASLTTVPLPGAAGAELLMNTEPDWPAGAWIGVEVRDAGGRAIEGYCLDDCGRMEADGTEVPVRWGGKARLPEGKGPLRVHVHLHRQRLYAMRLRS
ncbi:MAG TPA: hypothetical protein VM389_04300 [Phycisphaerae bacterium]|nr:hypothetical protein [Phycisphaerae bacterium]